APKASEDDFREVLLHALSSHSPVMYPPSVGRIDTALPKASRPSPCRTWGAKSVLEIKLVAIRAAVGAARNARQVLSGDARLLARLRDRHDRLSVDLDPDRAVALARLDGDDLVRHRIFLSASVVVSAVTPAGVIDIAYGHQVCARLHGPARHDP